MASVFILELLIILIIFFTVYFYPFLFGLVAYSIYYKIKQCKRRVVSSIDRIKMTGAEYATNKELLFTFRNDIRIPRIGNKEILVQVYAASINPVDYKFVTSKKPIMRWFYDHYGIGNDVAGKVIAVGEKVAQFKVGDDVFGFAKDGSLQEYTRCVEADLVIKPSNVTFNQAASLVLAGETSYQAMTWFFPIEGKTILIIGASGGTGHLAIQIAKYLNAAKIYGVCSSGKADYVRSLGADKVIEYNKEDYLQDFEDMTFDLIYDTVTSADDADQEMIYRSYLKPDGKYVAINSKSRFDFAKGTINSHITKIRGLEPTNFHIHLLVHNQKDTELLGKMASEGKLTSYIEVINFNENNISAGFNALIGRRARGKIVFELVKEQ